VHDVDLVVAVAPAHERDLLTVGRPVGANVARRGVVRELLQAGAVVVDHEDVGGRLAAVIKGDLLPVRGEARPAARVAREQRLVAAARVDQVDVGRAELLIGLRVERRLVEGDRLAVRRPDGPEIPGRVVRQLSGVAAVSVHHPDLCLLMLHALGTTGDLAEPGERDLRAGGAWGAYRTGGRG